MHIYIVGAGWVGLVTAGAFAQYHRVTVVDCDRARIQLLQKGEAPFFEEGLQELLAEGKERGNLVFTEGECEDEDREVPDIIFCTVGTPPLATGHADLSAVFSAAETYAQRFPQRPFVVKSTVPPGTCAALQERFPQLYLASNPEFLAEGTAVQDALTPARIVFGTQHVQAHSALMQVYAPWCAKKVPIIATDCSTSELAKYAANAFLATKISFVNEIQEFAEAVGANMHVISESMGLDPRIGPRFLAHGLGYGGSCFPKDTQALLAAAEQRGVALPLVRAAEERNVRQRERFFEKIVKAFLARGRIGHVALLGMAYKAGTTDIRSSPAVYLLQELRAQGIPVRWFDPRVVCMGEEKGEETCAQACMGASVVFVATAWQEIGDFARNLPQEQVIWGRSLREK